MPLNRCPDISSGRKARLQITCLRRGNRVPQLVHQWRSLRKMTASQLATSVWNNNTADRGDPSTIVLEYEISWLHAARRLGEGSDIRAVLVAVIQ